MIILKSLKWSNWFSYGEDNYLNLEDASLIQISGKNGTGKTSIPLILEEILFNKNHKGKRKQTLVNRYIKNPLLTAELIFSKDNVDYKVKIIRKGTVKIQFFKGNDDLSSHTSTNTYKTIQKVLGIDFKVFVQLIYQSSKMNLEFLEATDSNRKKFLISLFNLDKYLEIHEVFKKAESSVNTEISILQGKLTTIEAWITKHINEDLTIKTIKELPKINNSDIDKLTEYKSKLLNIKDTNIKINKNNQYKELLKNLDTRPLSYTYEIPEDKKDKLEERRKAQHKITESKTKLNIHKANIKKIRLLADKCPTCSHNITEEFKDNLVKEQHIQVLDIEKYINITSNNIIELEKILKSYNELEAKIKEKERVSDDFSKLQNLIDKDIPTEVIIENDLITNIKALKDNISSITIKINDISKYNNKIEINNSRVNFIKEQLSEYKNQAGDIREQLYDIEDQQGKLGILKKAFSTNGLLNYKIDYLIKDLELQINSYLQELSSGKFQIVFILQDEKLNIEILDEGIPITIEEVSDGELARINTATLLAIRKLMSAISSTKLNILFLDEVLGVLDDDGKEKLIEVLHKEKELNTFLVSHEYSHPLIPKINIIKDDKISRIDHG